MKRSFSLVWILALTMHGLCSGYGASLKVNGLALAQDRAPTKVKATDCFYKVTYRSFEVGKARFKVIPSEDSYRIHYRVRILVTILGATVYELDSEQIADFDLEHNMLRAEAKADIDGDKHRASYVLSKKGEQTDEKEALNTGVMNVTYNGGKKEIPVSEFVFTTLDPIVRDPIGGGWLDLTYGKVLPYTVKHNSGEYFITRPDGKDQLKRDKDGFLGRLISKQEDSGTLKMIRISVSEAKEIDVDLPSILGKVNF